MNFELIPHNSEDSKSGQLSIDIHLFDFAETLKNLGHKVTIKKIGNSKQSDFDFTLLSPYELYNFNEIEEHYLRSTVLSLPAIWWLEYPDIFPEQFIYQLLRFASIQKNYILVPNPRIKDYLVRFFFLHLRRDLSSRILISQYKIRQEKRSINADSSINLIEAGGIWRWTDILTFSRAYEHHLQDRQNSKLHLTLFRKPNSNKDHDAYQEAVMQQLNIAYKVGRVDFKNWGNVATLNSLLSESSVGLHLNPESVEGFLSNRIRFFKYLEFGLTVLSTRESYLYQSFKKACLGTEANYTAYRDILERLESWKISSYDISEAVETHDLQVKETVDSLIYGAISGDKEVANSFSLPTLSLIIPSTYPQLKFSNELNSFIGKNLLENLLKDKTFGFVRLIKIYTKFKFQFFTVALQKVKSKLRNIN